MSRQHNNESLQESALLHVAGLLEDVDERRRLEALLADEDPDALQAINEAAAVTAGLSASVEPVAPSTGQWDRLRRTLDVSAGRIGMPQPPAHGKRSVILPMLVAAVVAAGVTLGIGYGLTRADLNAADRLLARAQEAEAQSAELQAAVGRQQVDLLTTSNQLSTSLDRLADTQEELDALRDRLALESATADDLAAELSDLRREVSQARGEYLASALQSKLLKRQLTSSEADLKLALATGSTLAALAGTEARPTAAGRVVLNREAKTLRLSVNKLPAADGCRELSGVGAA